MRLVTVLRTRQDIPMRYHDCRMLQPIGGLEFPRWGTANPSDHVLDGLNVRRAAVVSRYGGSSARTSPLVLGGEALAMQQTFHRYSDGSCQ